MEKPDNQTGIARVTRSKAQARASYDRISRWYGLLAGWAEKKSRETGLAKLDARKGERILEIGFGTGHGLVSLARSVGESGRVCGLDISAGMLQIARRRLAKAGLSGRVDLRRGDATRLPFGVGSFTALFMCFTLELFDTPEIPLVLRECRRVLRRGGRLLVVALSKKRDTRATRIYECLHARFPNHADCRPIFARRALEKAGFRVADDVDLPLWGLLCEIVLAKKP